MKEDQPGEVSSHSQRGKLSPRDLLGFAAGSIGVGTTTLVTTSLVDRYGKGPLIVGGVGLVLLGLIQLEIAYNRIRPNK